MKYDAETKEQLARAEAIEAMLSSSGWAFAKQDLNEIIGQLRDVRQIDLTRDDAANQILVNAAIADNLEEWLNGLESQVNNAIIVSDVKVKSTLVERR